MLSAAKRSRKHLWLLFQPCKTAPSGTDATAELRRHLNRPRHGRNRSEKRELHLHLILNRTTPDQQRRKCPFLGSFDRSGNEHRRATDRPHFFNFASLAHQNFCDYTAADPCSDRDRRSHRLDARFHKRKPFARRQRAKHVAVRIVVFVEDSTIRPTLIHRDDPPALGRLGRHAVEDLKTCSRSRWTDFGTILAKRPAPINTQRLMRVRIGSKLVDGEVLQDDLYCLRTNRMRTNRRSIRRTQSLRSQMYHCNRKPACSEQPENTCPAESHLQAPQQNVRIPGDYIDSGCTTRSEPHGSQPSDHDQRPNLSRRLVPP